MEVKVKVGLQDASQALQHDALVWILGSVTLLNFNTELHDKITRIMLR